MAAWDRGVLASQLARIGDFLLREPLLHFAIGGGLIFLAYALWAEPGTGRETITVMPERAAETIRQQTEQGSRPLTPADQAAVIQWLIDEEVLVREAYRRGIDRFDPLVRARLVDKMRFLLIDEPPVPTRQQLDDYLAAHADRYRTRWAVSLEHVFFRHQATPPDTSAALAALRAGVDFHTLGDRFPQGATLEAFDQESLTSLLGGEFAQRVMQLPTDAWTGPLKSTQGIHVVRVTRRAPPHIPQFDELEPDLKRHWVADQREASWQHCLEELRKQYTIQRPVLDLPSHTGG